MRRITVYLPEHVVTSLRDKYAQDGDASIGQIVARAAVEAMEGPEGQLAEATRLLQEAEAQRLIDSLIKRGLAVETGFEEYRLTEAGKRALAAPQHSPGRPGLRLVRGSK